MRRRLLLCCCVVAVLGTALPATADNPFTPPREQWYAENDTGHWSAGTRVRVDAACADLTGDAAVACSLEAFKTKPFTVIAFVDSGINAYHQDFRAPDFVHHPSAFIEGYPADTESLDLSLGVADAQGYAAARTADDAALRDVARSELRWIPGTRVIGGISVAGGGGGTFPDRPILDENGHGTGVASVAAGQFFGADPNALVVMVEGLGDASVEWAANQPWIDIVSNSWGPGLPGRADVGLSSAIDATRESFARGQSTLFSSGNGMYNTNSSAALPPELDPCECKIPGRNVSATAHTSGPSWIITVGAVSPVNGQAHWWHGIPVDVASFGSKWRAADAFGVTREQNRDFGGTSCATPITAGVLSAVILAAREALGDTVGGNVDGLVARLGPGAVAPVEGPLAGGSLSREQAEAITLSAAQPVPFDPDTFTWDYAVEPTTDASYVQQGYGVMDTAAKSRALDVLSGAAPAPDRTEVDDWITETDQARDTIWGTP